MRALALCLACACSAGGPAPCPGIVTAASCVTFTPAMSGAAPDGEGAQVVSYALAPVAGRSGRLVLYLNGTGGRPGSSIGDPTENIYNVFVADGHHVLALSYRSSQALANLCFGRDGCFLPTRLTLVTGIDQPGSVVQLQQSEGIEPRLLLALDYLAAARPQDGWDSFLDGGTVRWPSIIATGHSQGGGHAALLAKLHPLARFVALSAPCDMVDGAAASWLHADASWQTAPAARGYGFSAPTVFDADGAPVGGDLNCPGHAAAWSALALDPGHAFDDAVGCGGNPHGAPIACPQNFARIQALFQL